jgi:hypothetical protein
LQAEQGYLILAVNQANCDYVTLARRLAGSIRQWHPHALVALMSTSPERYDEFTHHVTVAPSDVGENPYAIDPKIFYYTPFRETIKLEADMIMASECDHWWQMFRHRDIVVSTGCRTWLDQPSIARDYRKIFDINDLPDVYNAITYWRRSLTAKKFFDLAQDIFDRWEIYSRTIRFAETQPSTDVVYAMAAKIIGSDLVTMPFASYPKIVHMKAAHAGTQRQNWCEDLVWETDPLRIQTVAQWGAFHYNNKDWKP